MREEVLAAMNTLIREEKGRRVAEGNLMRDAELDSFGICMFFIELDAEYNYFDKMGNGDDAFKHIPYDTITISEIIDTCVSETTSTSNQP